MISLIIVGMVGNPINISANNINIIKNEDESTYETRATVTARWPIYSVCSGSTTYETYTANISSRGPLIKQGGFVVKPSYDAWFKEFTTPILIYTYVDSYGIRYTPFDERNFSEASIQHQLDDSTTRRTCRDF